MASIKPSKRPACALLLLLLLLAGLVSSCLFTLLVSGSVIDKSSGVSYDLSECRVDSIRLPRRVEPKHYDLLIEPDLDSLTFKGEVKINVDTSKDTKHFAACMPFFTKNPPADEKDLTQVHTCDSSNIILHADRDLEIISVHFTLEDGKDEKIKVTGMCRDSKKDMLVINLNRQLSADLKGQLELNYQGQIPYSADASDSNGRYPYFVSNTFSAVHARDSFPCFDEPDMKATFSVTMKHAPNLKALSNTLAISEQSDETKTVFAQTPLMPTYLVAFTVGQFDHVEATASDGMQIGIWSPHDNDDDPYDLALTSAVRAYSAVRDYFQTIELPLKKIDFVGYINQYYAMEYWGLITIREDHFPVEDFEDPNSQLRGFALMTRELVHQWIGNLVTFGRWWDDLWLTEGINRMIAEDIQQQLYPEHRYNLITMALEWDWALQREVTEETRPIRNPSHETNLPLEAYKDTTTYRSVAILRMLGETMKPGMMQEGINKFLGANLYKNVAVDDLFSSLEKTSGSEVGKFMASWTEQEGYPLVRVKLSPDSRTLILTQERFGMKTGEKNEQKWIIPMNILINYRESVESLKIIMKDQQLTVRLPDSFDIRMPYTWLKISANPAGFYRVLYEDDRLMYSMEAAITTQTMEAADRLNFLLDICALTSDGHYSLQQLQYKVGAFRQENEGEIMLVLAQYLMVFEYRYDEDLTYWRQMVLDYYQREISDGGPATSGSAIRQSTLLAVEDALVKLGLLEWREDGSENDNESEYGSEGESEYESENEA